MIPAALPAATDTAEPAAPVRAPKGVPFAAVIEAVPADAVSDPQTDGADAADPAAEPVADTVPPVAPAIGADAAALIAQLCPPPDATAAIVPDSQSPTRSRPSRESGNPASADLDSPVASKATPHAGKPARQAGKSAPARPEAFADAIAKPVEAPAVPIAPSARTADATAAIDALVAAPPGDVAITRHLDVAHDAQWLDGLARDIARSADHNANLRFSLAPEHLGRLTVDLAANADGTAVRLTTESEAAHRIVSEAQPRLVAEARAQGLRISETQVDLDQRQSGGQQPQRAPDGQSGQDRARPAVLWTEAPQRSTRAAVAGVPAARDLYA